MMDSIEKQLQEMGFNLPQPVAPVGSYLPWKIEGGLLYVSGQLPFQEGKLIKGCLVEDKEDQIRLGKHAAEISVLNLLSQVKNAINSLNQVASVIKITGYVNCSGQFTQIPEVINGASDLLFRLFGERGRHIRVAVGCSLPLGALVEVEGLFSITKD